jgi:hypothetical protein
MKRLGGISGQAKISASDILGYGSALDQLGQKQEMAATAHGKVMIDMFKDSAKYAEIAKMETSDFAHLLETDANEAFLKVLEGLNGNNEGMSVMAKKLDGLGIDGARAVQVLSVLASNTDMVRKEQALANKAMEEGISLTKEYEVKNNNLAGSWEKIGRYVRGKFINSSFISSLEGVIGKMAKWTEIPLAEKLTEQRSEVNKLAFRVASLTEGTDEHRSAMNELIKTYPEYFGSLDSAKTKNSELLTVLKSVNRQMIRQIYIAGRREELQKLQENASEKLGIEMGYQEELDNIKASYFSKMGKKQQEIFAGDFDFIMNHYKKIRDVHGDGIKSQMLANHWLKKNSMYAIDSKGGLDAHGLAELSIAYEGWRGAYIKRFAAERDAQAQEQKILKWENQWFKNEKDKLKVDSDSEDGNDGGNEIAKKESLIEVQEELLKQAKLMPETTEAEIAVKNKRIAQIEKEIKRLNDLGGKTIDVEALRVKALEDGLAKEIELEKKRHNDKLKEYKGNTKAIESEEIIHKNNLTKINKDHLAKMVADNSVMAATKIALLEELRNDELISEEEFNQAKEAIEKDHQQKLYEFKKKYQKITDEELLQQEIEYVQSHNEWEHLTEEEQQRILASIREKWQQKSDRQFISATEKRVAEQVAIIKEGFDKEQKAAFESGRNMIDIAHQVGDVMTSSFGAFFDESISGFEEFGKQMLLLTLNLVKKEVQLYYPLILAREIASKGPWGVASAAGLILMIEAAFAGATALVGSWDTRKEKGKGKKAGGYTDSANTDDEIVDFVHSNEFVANANAVRNPTVKPVLDLIDMAQRSGSITTLNLPELIGAGGRKSGGFTTGSPRGDSPSPSLQSQSDPDQNAINAALAEELRHLRENGIEAYTVLTGKGKFYDRDKYYQKLKSKVSM